VTDGSETRWWISGGSPSDEGAERGRRKNKSPDQTSGDDGVEWR
jgi:hypothetical protein